MPVEEEESDGEDAVGKKKSKPKGIPLPCAAKKSKRKETPVVWYHCLVWLMQD